MAPTAAQPGSYFEFDNVANDAAAVAFKVLEFQPDFTMPNGVVNPVVADVLVLTGKLAGQVVRNERIIGKGITGTLRRNAVGADVICTMGWGKFGATNYVQANPPTPEHFATACKAFAATGDDPYSAAERASRPSAGPVAAAPAAPPVQPQPEPVAVGAGASADLPW